MIIKGGNMANLVKKSFDKPDDLVAPDKTRAEILEFGTIKAVRVTAQPGWTWSECIKPHVGGESCQAGHLGACIQGSMSCLLYTSPSPRDRTRSRMPSSA